MLHNTRKERLKIQTASCDFSFCPNELSIISVETVSVVMFRSLWLLLQILDESLRMHFSNASILDFISTAVQLVQQRLMVQNHEAT